MVLEGVVIRWQTPLDEIGCLHYGTQELSEKACETDVSNYHRIELHGLKKATTYHYVVDSESLRIDNEGRSFTTLDDDVNKTQRIFLAPMLCVGV